MLCAHTYTYIFVTMQVYVFIYVCVHMYASIYNTYINIFTNTSIIQFQMK